MKRIFISLFGRSVADAGKGDLMHIKALLAVNLTPPA
jgi:hypothetical protein